MAGTVASLFHSSSHCPETCTLGEKDVKLTVHGCLSPYASSVTNWWPLQGYPASCLGSAGIRLQHTVTLQAVIASVWTHKAGAKSCPQRAVQNKKMFSISNMWMFFSNRVKNMASELRVLIPRRQAHGHTLPWSTCQSRCKWSVYVSVVLLKADGKKSPIKTSYRHKKLHEISL